MTIKRIIFAAAGCICLGLGSIGIVLPVLPTVPFFLLTVFFFANSSQKLHDWFVGTTIYKKHLDSFVKKRAMTAKTKITILTSVTLIMGIGFFIMIRNGIIVPSIILAAVWLCHVFYFAFKVNTIKGDVNQPDMQND